MVREVNAYAVSVYIIIFILALYPSLCIQIGFAWKEAEMGQTEPTVIYVCVCVLRPPVIYEGCVYIAR